MQNIDKKKERKTSQRVQKQMFIQFYSVMNFVSAVEVAIL